MIQTQSKTPFSGIGFAIATAILIGLNAPLAKVFVTQVQPWMLAGLLFCGGGLGLLPIYLIRNRLASPTNALRQGDWKLLWTALLINGIVAPVLLMTGLTTTPASVASLLLEFEGAFTAVLAWTFFRERWHWRIFLGVVIVTIGGILLTRTNQNQAGLSWGTLAILGTCLAWAIDSNLTKQFADRDPVQVALLKTGVPGLINVAIALLLGQALPPLLTLLQILSVGFVTYGLTLMCLVLALRNLGASRMAAYFALAPFVGTAIAIVFLGETVTDSLVMASGFMLLGAALCAAEPG